MMKLILGTKGIDSHKKSSLKLIKELFYLL